MSQPSGPQQPFVVPSGPPQWTPPPPPPPSGKSSNRTLWIVLGIIGSVLLLSCFGGLAFVGYTIQQRASAIDEFDQGFDDFEDTAFASDFPIPTTDPVDTSAAVSLNQLVEAGDFDVTITDVRFDQGTTDIEPQPGNEFVVIEMEITNRSRRSLSPDTEFYSSTWLQDSENKQYECCNYDLEDMTALYGPLRSGATNSVTIVYEAPQATGDLYWVYEEYYDDRRVAVKIR